MAIIRNLNTREILTFLELEYENLSMPYVVSTIGQGDGKE